MRRILATLLFFGVAGSLPHAAPALLLPNNGDSLKVAVLGDTGTGKQPQMEVAAQMAASHQQFPFELGLNRDQIRYRIGRFALATAQ